MAEVSLRLLRSKARHRLVEERIACGGKHACMLVLPFVAPSEPINADTNFRMQLYTLWPSGAPGSRTVKPRQGVRVYSQWTGSRAYYHQNGSRRNGTQGVESSLYKSRTAYYDILEVTGNATQSQIKTAYYKQSFRYHPDRNAGSEDAARQFGHVTEAYHVLGSVSLRKKYDRGLLSLEDVRSAKKPSGKSSSPSRKEAGGQRDASSSSRTPAKPMFDFDAFYQAHYGEQLAREQLWKARREHIEKMKKQEKNMAFQFNKLGEVSALLLVVSAAALVLLLR
ncbi:dnaJ homolog subfamily C member 30, mitochondrial [Hyla sarda]|uniref:dnaJ homolog subfamily C member 30, mitochondrial n=1 Tax=Hyla sarda TaxID=327740 RepID=UPI0024C29CC9|nr:dnaJ homolog subfamily C member 30, mitochondrial [Hyla sarda]